MAAKELGVQPTDPEKTDAEKNEPEKKKREYKDFGHEQEGPTSPCFLFTGSASLTFFLEALVDMGTVRVIIYHSIKNILPHPPDRSN